MSALDKIFEGNTENKNATASHIATNPLDNFPDANTSSYRLQTSHNSTISNESDLSLLSLSLDKELAENASIDIDELPAFEIRLISPLGRTPSPIDSEDTATPTKVPLLRERLTSSPCRNNPEFVALHDINAQISPPSDQDDEVDTSLSRTSSLETIFEGVFLNTPPRQRLSVQNNRSRTNLLEKVALNRLNVGKENQSPLSKCKTLQNRRSLMDFSCVTDPCAAGENHTST